MLCYDIGGLNGEDSLRWLKMGHDVLTVEPLPTGKLREAVEAWIGEATDLRGKVVDRPTWTLVEAAAVPNSHRGDTIDIHVHPDRPELNSCVREWGDVRKVGTVRLWDLFVTHGLPGLLKMDIEGFEHGILREIQALPVPYLICELSDVRIIEEASRLGYTRFRISDQNQRSGWPPEYRDNDGCGPFGDELLVPWTDAAGVFNAFEELTKGKGGDYWADLHCERERGEESTTAR